MEDEYYNFNGNQENNEDGVIDFITKHNHVSEEDDGSIVINMIP